MIKMKKLLQEFLGEKPFSEKEIEKLSKFIKESQEEVKKTLSGSPPKKKRQKVLKSTVETMLAHSNSHLANKSPYSSIRALFLANFYLGEYMGYVSEKDIHGSFYKFLVQGGEAKRKGRT